MFEKFPSIGQFRDFVKELKKLRSQQDNPPTEYHLTGTVKLHGTHADILINKDPNSGEFSCIYQSRNRILDLIQDNYGFAAAMSNIPVKEFTKLCQAIENVYLTDCTHSEEVREVHSIVIAGEWCGLDIQKGVALTQLPKMFVIFQIKINDVRQRMNLFDNISLEDHGIYNISRSPSFALTIKANDMVEILPELQRLTDQVENECPFSKSFGVSGIGEGLVWVCDEHYNQSRTWFKVKGKQHSMTTHLDISAKEKQNLRQPDKMIEVIVTESRLNQGLDYMREMQHTIVPSNCKIFVDWVVSDVFKEENDVIAEVGINPKALKKAISQYSGNWYQQQRKLIETQC